MNRRQFELDLSRVIAKAKGNGERVARAIVIDLMQRVIKKTPVDRGFARNRWALAVNQVDNGEYGADPSGGQAIARNLQALTSFKVGDTIFLTNNMPYIFKLEYGLYGKPPGSANGPKTVNGYSSRAKSGFVRITYQETVSNINRIVAGAVK